MAPRPMLRPGLASLRRSPTSIQIGVDERLAVAVSDVDAAVIAAVMFVLSILDGAHELSDVEHQAEEHGLSPVRLGDLVALLEEAGVLVWRPAPAPASSRVDLVEAARLAPDLASLALTRRGCARVSHPVSVISTTDGSLDPHSPGGADPFDGVEAAEDASETAMRARRDAWVEVIGAGRVGAAIAETLAATGIGRLTVVDDETVSGCDLAPLGARRDDLGKPRGPIVRERIGALSTSTRTYPAAVGSPTVTVLAPDTGPDVFVAATWSRSGLVHVPAYVREYAGNVGPLVLPGRSTCLRCIDLHRSDRDPAWPMVAGQLGRPGLAVAACDIALATLVAAQASLHVLAYIEGDRPASVGAVLQTTLPHATTVRRCWPPHPRCGCGAATAYDDRP